MQATAEQAQQVMIGLKNADLSYAGQAIQRQHQQFDLDTNQLADLLKIYMSPEHKVLAAYLKAAKSVENDRPEFPKLFLGGYDMVPLELPVLSGFSHYYASVQQSAPQLGASGSNENPEPQTASSTGKPESEKI